MRVCYFGSYDPIYPRNKIIREGLALNGVEVIECNIPFSQGGRLASRYRQLNAKWATTRSSSPDILILPEFNHKNFLLAVYLARRDGIPLVFDPFVSMYNTNIEDRKRVKKKSFKALHDYMLDLLGFRWPDALLADTKAHKSYFCNKWGSNPDRVHVVYVGADEQIFYPVRGNKVYDNPTVLFFGTYIPLHGTNVIIKAFDQINRSFNSNTRYVMIGDGQTFNEGRRLAQSLNISNLEFVQKIPIEQLASAVREATICLGIFGETEKTQRVIPNKVFQAMCSQKPVITGDSLAVREIFQDRENILFVPCGDDKSLAQAVIELLSDADLAHNLASEGGELIQRSFIRIHIGRQVLEVLKKVLANA